MKLLIQLFMDFFILLENQNKNHGGTEFYEGKGKCYEQESILHL